jgi:trehalose/maltose hydrolase-like predicted phosphorylase
LHGEAYRGHLFIGPDEYHTRYPGAQEPGINNNAYTNVMVAWVMMRALDVCNLLDSKRKTELLYDLDIDSEELGRWQQISQKIFVPIENI